MKKLYLPLCLFSAMSFSVCSCKKSAAYKTTGNDNVIERIHELSEIGLNFKVSYSDKKFKDFQIRLPENFKMEQSSILFNAGSGMEYFSFRCSKTGEAGVAYIVNGIIKANTSEFITSFAKVVAH